MKALSTATLLCFGFYATSVLAAPVTMSDAQMNEIVAGDNFTVVNKVADRASVGAPTTDPLLVNPWGLSQAPGGPLWTANNGTGTSTLYDASIFAKVPLTVAIRGVDGGTGNPTGTLFTSFNDTGSFPGDRLGARPVIACSCSTPRTARSRAGRRA